MRRRILTRLLLAAIVLGGCAAVWQALLAAPPAGLGDTLAGFTYACDGDVYTLPTPVAEYLANGWELEQPPAPAMPAMEHIREWAAEFPVSETRMLESGEEREIYLSRGEKGGIVRIADPAEKPAALRDCVVVEIQGSLAYDMDVELPGGICLDSGYRKFQTRLEELAGPDAEITRTTSNDYDTFVVNYPDGGYYRFPWLTFYGASLESFSVYHPADPCVPTN